MLMQPEKLSPLASQLWRWLPAFIVIFGFAPWLATAQQTITNVNVGTAANSGTGDPLRTSFIKINTNTTFLNSALNGQGTTHSYVQSLPEWGSHDERLPWRGIYRAGSTQNTITNDLNTAKTIGAYQRGFNMFGADVNFYANTRSANNLQVNTSLFPDGTGFVTLLHSLGGRFLLWYDNANVPSGYPVGVDSVSQSRIDEAYILANFGPPDALWNDDAGPDEQDQLAGDMATNRVPPVLMLAGGLVSGNGNPIADNFARSRHVRIHGTAGDVNNWGTFIDYMDEIETNAWWKWISPGHTVLFGPEVGAALTDTERDSTAVLQGMVSADFMPTFAYSEYYIWTTNDYYLAIQGDPAVVCARRLLTTNGIWCYLKPLGSAYGPDYALALVNTSAAPATATIPFNKLVGPVASGGIALARPTYEVFDVMAQSALGSALSQVTASSLASHASLLYRLMAPTRSGSITNLYNLDTLNVVVRGNVTNDGSFIGNGSVNAAYEQPAPGNVKIMMGPNAGSAAASMNQAFLANYASSGSAQPNLIIGWNSSGYIGLGQATSANDNYFRIGGIGTPGYGQAWASADAPPAFHLFNAGDYEQPTNALANWTAATSARGGFQIVNSNGTPYIRLTGPASTTITATQQLAMPNFTILAGGESGSSIVSGTPRYFSADGGANSTTEANNQTLFGRVVTITNLFVRWSSIGNNTNFIATIWTNGVASSVTCNVNGAGAVASASDTTHAVRLPQGQGLTVELKGNNPSLGTPNVTWSFEIWPAQ